MLLYKYLSPDRSDILTKLRIRFSPPGAFNDPFEFKPVLTALVDDSEFAAFADAKFDEYLDREMQKQVPLWKQLPKPFVEQFRRTLRAQLLPTFQAMAPGLRVAAKRQLETTFSENFGILCLSEHWNSSLMWGHYGSSHAGFVLGFDSTHPFFNRRRSEHDEFHHLRKVRYVVTRPQVTLSNSGGVEWFDTKASCWSYEDEHRMFLPLRDACEVTEHNGSPIHLFSFPIDCVREVVVGYNANSAVETKLRQAVTECENKLQFFRARIHETEYTVLRDQA